MSKSSDVSTGTRHRFRMHGQYEFAHVPARMPEILGGGCILVPVRARLARPMEG